MRRLTGALVMVLALLAAPGVASAQHELSTSDHLKSRRYVAAGDRAYVMGFEDGRFYAQGWHITGEMGGVWSQPLKLVDGVWFGVDDQWVGPATKFTSGWGYTRMDLPDIDGLKLTRIDFAPDGHRAALIGLRIDNPEAARQVSVKVDARSEVMAQYPWGWTTPGAGDFNAADTGAYTGGALQFRNTGTQSSGAHAPEEEHLLSGAASRQLATPAGRSSRGRGPGSRAAVELGAVGLSAIQGPRAIAAAARSSRTGCTDRGWGRLGSGRGRADALLGCRGDRRPQFQGRAQALETLVYPNGQGTAGRWSGLLDRHRHVWRVSKKLPVRDCQRVPHPRGGDSCDCRSRPPSAGGAASGNRCASPIQADVR